MKNRAIILTAILFISLLGIPSTYAQKNRGISIGLKVIGENRKGETQSSGRTFDSTDGGQFGFNLNFRKRRAYTGASFQGGKYKFENSGPDIVTTIGALPFSNGMIKYREVNLIAGYFFWEHVSLFVGVKSIEDEWENVNFKQSFTGVGGGVSGIWPINAHWDFYGSAAFIPEGEVKTNKAKSGDGKSTTLEFGTVYRLSERDRFTLGLKFSTVVYAFDSGDEQEMKTNGLFIGYSHYFPF